MEWKQLFSPQRAGQTRVVASEQSRSAFEQDYDRIIFSQPFRRLQDKTQVHPLPEYDFVHTRLTHSLEVSSVGRSLGKRVGEELLKRHPELAPEYSLFDLGSIVAAASLAHDLGNPPFGHAGEDAISDFFLCHEQGQQFKVHVSEAEWCDLIKFEGNAQGFRILNKNQYGLKLTYATLGAFTKYPCPAFFPNRDKNQRSQKKFGFFQSEKDIFTDVAGQLGLATTSDISWNRHPLAFLVEAADDICYSIIDLEDGCSLGLVGYEEARQLFENVLTKGKTKIGKLGEINGQQEKIGYLRALAIGDLMGECATLFLDHEQEILKGTFDVALADKCPSWQALEQIIKVSQEKIYRARKVVEIEAAGHEVLPGLLEEFSKAGMYLMEGRKSRKYENLQKLFPAEIEAAIRTEKNVYNMLRLVIDFVSGLTDRHALSLYRRIKGISF
ncbi:deoxyguanosinetriphosphate triphosphohydrolase [Parachryseolinea silvisoli]|jgi:dGTPase|uniref:deoxyguanosinetriphosphate triphosphohydrolase n=1 Tax=Parachryseolinea silvisoli TaxID=2873601 RepID=UPI002265B714|nr:deoxyguanosinetriphosphate triphosphohydrolase [Parachryseolinea silvisoli]MCD9016771.1 deoxyguanosinetriphosphate triphosphohydrolase [Parachryseolinea silvisoli]